MRKYFGITVLAAVVLLSGCKGANKPAGGEVRNEKITNVEIFTAEAGTFNEYITLPVLVAPFREASLGLVQGGKVIKIYADKGNRVAEGKMLLETDTDIINANLRTAEATLEYQKSEFARNQKLYDTGSITDAVFDASKLALAQAQSAYDAAKKQLENATLEAPFSGVITERNVEVGDILGAASPAFRIIEMDRVKVQAGVPEKYIGDFKAGNRVSIRFDSIPSKEFDGRINYIAPEASSSVRSFIAEIVVDNRQGLIKAGIMGNARILKRVYQDAIQIPLNAVIQIPDGRIVFVLQPDNTAEQRTVEIGPTSDLMVMIEKGVNPGDRIIVKGQQEIASGEKVRVVEESASPDGEDTGQ